MMMHMYVYDDDDADDAQVMQLCMYICMMIDTVLSS